jgi:hypothetical protein
MKKIVSIVGMAALVAGLSFGDAGVSLSGWSRAELKLSNQGVANPTLSIGPSWDSTGARLGFTLSGHSDNAFAQLDLQSNGGGNLYSADQAKVGVKFNEFVTVQVGKIQGDVLRGKFGDLYASGVASTGEDDIFTRFNPANGGLLDLTPVAGLYIGAAIDATSTGVAVADFNKKTQVGVGYTIDKVGLIRAQFRGAVDPIYEAAFQLTAIDKVNIDAGVKIPTASGAKVSAAAAASYAGIDKVDLQARFKYQDKTAGGLLVGGQVAYNVDGPLFVGAGASANGLTTDGTVSYDGSVFAKLAYSNGYAKIAFIQDNSTFTIPVSVEVWF